MPRKPKSVTGRPTAVLRMSGIPLTDGSPGVPIVVADDGAEYELVGVRCGCHIECGPGFTSEPPLWVQLTVENWYRYPGSPNRKAPKKKAPNRAKAKKGRR